MIVLSRTVRSAAFCRRVSSANSLEWRVDIAPEADRIKVNKELLLLVLDNLVDNAIKFTEVAGYVAVSAVREDSQIRIRVADNGCGIPDLEQDRVFERFYRGPETAPTRGSGIGLSLVKNIAQAHGGRAWAKNAAGGGAVVGFSIPVAGGVAAA